MAGNPCGSPATFSCGWGKFLGSLEVPGPQDGSLWVPMGSLGSSIGSGWFLRFLSGSWDPTMGGLTCPLEGGIWGA